MDELEEYKELYYKEIEYTERLNSKINMCMTFLTIIGSGVILVWSQLGKASPSIYFWIYLILCIMSSVSFIICIIFFYKAYSGYEIHYYPIKEMAERYLNDAIHNREQNRLKNKRHRRLIHLVAITFMILLVNFAVSIYFSNCTDIDINVNNCQWCEGGEKNGK